MTETHWDTVIVGAGAAGLSVATMCAASGRSAHTLLLDAHETVGGSAGYFGRGFPKRVHDAGATQLIECGPGGLQRELLRLALGQKADDIMDQAVRIREIHHIWREPSLESVVLDDRGRIRAQKDMAECGEWRVLERFFEKCARDTHWLWKLFYTFPDFPPCNFTDLFSLLSRASVLSPREFWRACGGLSMTVGEKAQAEGLEPGTRSWKILSSLLLDTAQNVPEKTPYLVGAMGLSILQRGIVRLPRGMMDLFYPWEQGIKEKGLRVRKGHRVLAVHSDAKGTLRLTVQVAPANGSEQVFSIYCRRLFWAAPLSSLLSRVPDEDELRSHAIWQRWDLTLRNSFEWQACALHGIAIGAAPVKDDEPWYCQIFASAQDPGGHAIYLSIGPSRRDERAQSNFRVFTASLHVDQSKDRFFEDCNKDSIHKWMCGVIQEATGLQLEKTEVAVPRTFARYTSRSEGRVGGFVSSFENFLFNAVPKHLELSDRAEICLAGDSVFPGQGVVTTSLSGVLAWGRVFGENPQRYLGNMGNRVSRNFST